MPTAGTPPLFPRHPSSKQQYNNKPSLSSSSSPRTPLGSQLPPQCPTTPRSPIEAAWDSVLPTPRRRRFGGGLWASGGGGSSPMKGGGGFLKRADSAPALHTGSAQEGGALVAVVPSPSSSGPTVPSSSSSSSSVHRSSSATALSLSPRDAGAGGLMGITAVAAGIGLGLTSLVAAPVVGASSHGAKGFFAGLGAGLAGAVVLPVAGVVGGVTCAIGGMVNTPASVMHALRGRQWCPLQRKWIRYDLQEEARRVLGVDIDVTAPVPPAPDTVTPSAAAVVDEEGKEEQSGGGKKGEGGGKGGGKASSLSLYAVLGVEPSAGQEAIKRAYYREALLVHPDKRPNDPSASQRFQRLSEAYQVLSTPSLRAAYDKEGDAAYRDAVFVDPHVFFGMVFGAERFRPYLGKLFLASAMGALSQFAEDGGTGSMTPKGKAMGEGGGEEEEESVGNAASLGEAKRAMTTGQVKRELRIALHLLRILSPFHQPQQAQPQQAQQGGQKHQREGQEQQEGQDGRTTPSPPLSSFQRFCQQEAHELSQRALGPLILRELGVVYAQVAGAYLGGLSGLSASIDRRRVRLQRQAGVAAATVEAIKLGHRFVGVYSSNNASSSSSSAASTPTRRFDSKTASSSSKEGTRNRPLYSRSSSAPLLHTPQQADCPPPQSSGNTSKPPLPAPFAAAANGQVNPSIPASPSTASLATAATALGTLPGTLTPEAGPCYSSRSIRAQPDEEECKEQPPPLARSSSSSPASQQQEPDKEQQAAQRLEEEGLPRLVSVMWKMAAWDIMETVGRACNKLLSDTGASKEERRRRAQAHTHVLGISIKGLLELGRAFKAEAERCLEAAGGKVDYRREWEGLDREMFQRYESSASIHTMATTTIPFSPSPSPYTTPAATAAEEEEEDQEEEGGILVL